jgi:putative phosphoserine phosphatase / 1-acylglycerol-3-phosphate O-acyltransferase
MARAAAIVDVDRTLLTGRPGRTLLDGLHRAGVAVPPGPLRPAVDAAATASLSSQLSMLALLAGRGWPDAAVREAATMAAEMVVDDVAPYLRPLLDTHRSAGERLLVVSAAPPAIAEPLCGLLGAEDVVGTNWAEGRGFLGPIEGPLVWARSKADGGAAWLRSAGVSPGAASAYADNFFAGPLLASVGHATAVDPDARLTLLARMRGWPIRYLDVPEGVVKVAGRELQEWLRPFAPVEGVLNARIQITGLEHVPGRGGAILAFNHRSYFDAAVVNLVAARAGRAVRGLGKREVLDAPVLGQLARAVGTIRVDRGTGSDEPLEAAAEALRAGEMVMIAPQGTIPRGPAFFDPELKGRWGVARLAAMTRAPVIPMGLWGTEQVWPRNARLPRIHPLRRPHVTVRIGSPVDLTYDDPDTDTKRIMAALAELLPPEGRERRTPTEEELRRTYPAGYRGDPAREAARRPGRDI